MEKFPHSETINNSSEQEQSSAEFTEHKSAENQHTNANEKTQESKKEPGSEYAQAMRRAAQNAARLGMELESFSNLSLRNRTILSFLDVQKETAESIRAEEEEGKEHAELIFNADGVKYGETSIPYTDEIQCRIHQEYLDYRRKSPYFQEEVLEDNQDWREEMLSPIQKSLTSPITHLFSDFLKADHIDIEKLSNNEGLSQENFLALIQLESEVDDKTLAEAYVQKLDNPQASKQPTNWHIENATLYDKCTDFKITEKEFEELKNEVRGKGKEAWAICSAFETFMEKLATPAYKAYKYTPKKLYDINISFTEKVKEEYDDSLRFNFLGTLEPVRERERSIRKTLYLNLNDYKELKQPETNIKDAISSIADFAKSKELPIDSSALSNKEISGIKNTDVEDYIRSNANTLREYALYYNKDRIETRNRLAAKAKEARAKHQSMNDSDLIAMLNENPGFMADIARIYDAARKQEAIIKIYDHVSEDFMEEIKFDDKTNEAYTEIKNKYKQIKSEAAKRRVNLYFGKQRKDDVQTTLEACFGIHDDINTNIEKIMLEHSSELLKSLKKRTDDVIKFRKLENKRKARLRAEQEFAKRLTDAEILPKETEDIATEETPEAVAISEQSQVKEIQDEEIKDKELFSEEAQEEAQDETEEEILKIRDTLNNCEYFKNMKELSALLKSSRRLMLSIRKMNLKQGEGGFIDPATLKYSLGLLDNLELEETPDISESEKEFIDTVSQAKLVENPTEFAQEYISKQQTIAELRTTLAKGCETEDIRAKKSRWQQKYEAKISGEEKELIFAGDAARYWTKTYAEQTFQTKTVPEIASALGIDEKVKDILFMPGLMATINTKGKSSLIPIDSKQFAKSDSAALKFLADRADRPPFKKLEEDIFAREFLSKLILNEFYKNEAVGANKTEQRISSLSEKFNITFEQFNIVSKEGKLVNESTEAELNALETVYPFFGRFISSIGAPINSYAQVDPDAYADVLAETQKAYISNDTKQSVRIPSRLTRGRGRLDLTNLATLLRAKNIPKAKILELAANDIALSDYTTLNSETLQRYQRIAGNKLPRDPRTFMLLYQKLITNPTELMTCATRLSYCREFAKYCTGKASSQELKQFFDERSAEIRSLAD